MVDARQCPQHGDAQNPFIDESALFVGSLVMRPISFLAGIALALCSHMAVAQKQATAERSGELIYKTYCIGCHTTEVHWREKRLATDWASLKFQVRRWVDNTGVGLSEGEVLAVTRYLSRRYYRFTTPVAGYQHLPPPVSIWMKAESR